MKRGGHDGPQEGGGAEAPRMKRRANFNEWQKAKHRKQARNMRQEHETRKGDRKHQDKNKGKQKARGAYRSEKAGQTQRRQPRDTEKAWSRSTA